jgi:hypothetical protein
MFAPMELRFFTFVWNRFSKLKLDRLDICSCDKKYGILYVARKLQNLLFNEPNHI